MFGIRSDRIRHVPDGNRGPNRRRSVTIRGDVVYVESMTVDVRSGRDGPGLERVVGALDDDACREIVSALDEPMSAQEVADSADVPLSTTYRKLDKLTDASLVNEETEVRPDGHHRSRYVVDFERIVVELDEEREFDPDLERPRDTPEGRLANMWSEVRRGT